MHKLYEIRINEALAPAWAEWFDCIEVQYDPLTQQTIMQCNIADQAALYGMLNKLSTLGLTLVSVMQLPSR